MKGSIRRRSKGSWEVCLDVGRDPVTGKRLRQFETVKGSKKDAQKRLHELLHTREQGTYIKPTKLTVAQFLEEWLQDYVRTNTAPRTAERYQEIVRVHLIPALGSLPVVALQPHHIQKYYAQALETGRRDGKGGLSAQTVHHHHRVLYEALKYGVKHGILIRNVAEAVDAPRPEHRELSILRSNEIRLILDATNGTPYYAIFFALAYTGLRRSELLGLRWADIDLEKATLSVVQTLHQLRGGKYIFREPKSKRSRRQIALSPKLAIMLWEHRFKQEQAWTLLGKPLLPTDLVFSHPGGRPIRPDNVTRALNTVVRSLGLKGVRLHDLRHAHATILLKEGVHPKVVQERLGHSSVSTTLDIYSHVVPSLQQAAARKIDEGLELTPTEEHLAEVNQENVGKMSAELD
ncbi:MAG: tyrosine-type recombinase/integrase [Promethearchaeota archaeon]